jgi:hypothetical protein
MSVSKPWHLQFSAACENLTVVYLKWFKLGSYVGVPSLQGNGQDREEGTRTVCGHGF